MTIKESQLYDIQLDFISKAREIIKHGRIGIFSSPTGTGKTLSLLFSLKTFLKDKDDNFSEDALLDELFGTSEKTRIFYVSRTHSQLGQVIQELKNVVECKAVVLGSRKLYCINEKIKNSDIETLNLKCTSLVKNKECEYYTNYESLENSIDPPDSFDEIFHCDRQIKSLSKKGSNILKSTKTNHKKSLLGNKIEINPVKIHDIEDFISSCSKSKVCPYFLSKRYSSKCEILFMPYNLLFSKEGRKSLDIEIENSIIIVDEAHNLVETIIQMNTSVVSRFFIVRLKKLLQEYCNSSSEKLKGENRNLLSRFLEILDEFEEFFLINFPVKKPGVLRTEPQNNILQNKHILSTSENQNTRFHNNYLHKKPKLLHSFGNKHKSYISKMDSIDSSDNNLHLSISYAKSAYKKTNKMIQNKICTSEFSTHIQKNEIVNRNAKPIELLNTNSLIKNSENGCKKPILTQFSANKSRKTNAFDELYQNSDDINEKNMRNGFSRNQNDIFSDKINEIQESSNFGFISACDLSQKQLDVKTSESEKINEKNEMVISSSDFLAKTGIYNYNISTICEYVKRSKLVHKIGLSDKINEFYNFLKFLELLNESDSSGRVFYDQNTLKFTPMDSQMYFEDIIKCRSLILAGGTMEPIDDLVRVLYRENDTYHDLCENMTDSQDVLDGCNQDKAFSQKYGLSNTGSEQNALDLNLESEKSLDSLELDGILEISDNEEIDAMKVVGAQETIRHQESSKITLSKNPVKVENDGYVYFFQKFSKNLINSQPDKHQQTNLTKDMLGTIKFSSLENFEQSKKIFEKKNNKEIVSSKNFYKGVLEYHSYSHVCTNFSAQIITKGPSKINLTLNYKTKNDPTVIKEYMNAFFNYAKIVKTGGIVCFVPSVSYIDIIRNNLPKSLSEITLYDTDCTFEMYKNKLLTQNKTILFSVMGGKLSEGINFSDNLCRLLVIFGIPYPTKNLELAERERVYNELIKNNDYQTTVAMKTVNQAIGRAIRHKGDFSGIILMDSRYIQIKHLLSAWVRDKLIVSSFQESMHHLMSFYKRNSHETFDDF